MIHLTREIGTKCRAKVLCASSSSIAARLPCWRANRGQQEEWHLWKMPAKLAQVLVHLSTRDIFTRSVERFLHHEVTTLDRPYSAELALHNTSPSTCLPKRPMQ